MFQQCELQPISFRATKIKPKSILNCAAPGGSLTVTGSQALSMVAMLRMGSSTHSTNTDQRRLELCGPSTTACAGATPTVSVPGAGIALPGNWMVFGINIAGVVSVAEILLVT